MSVWIPDIQLADDVAGKYSIYRGSEIKGRNKAADFFHTFWCALCKDGHKPSRSDIKPAAIKQFLNRVVLMDVLGEQPDFQLVVKLIGTHVTAFYGELSGMDINAMPNKEAAKRIYKTCEQVLQHAEPVLSVTTGISRDKIHLEAFALYMPLYNDDGKISKIMAAVDIKSLLQ